MAERNLDPASVEGSGKRGQVLKEDVLKVLDRTGSGQPAATPAATRPAMTVGAPRAELLRDRMERDRWRESGVGAAAEPTLSSAPSAASPARPDRSATIPASVACTSLAIAFSSPQT